MLMLKLRRKRCLNLQMSVCNLRNLAKQKTCIDLILTNAPQSFQSSAYETGLSDFESINYSPETVLNYKDYHWKSRSDEFKAKLDNEILKHTNNTEYQHFLNIFIAVLNKNISLKQKIS